MLDAQLDLATRSYLQAETVIDAARCRVRLPRLMRLYGADFGGREKQLEFAADHLPDLSQVHSDGCPRVRVSHGHFAWTVTPSSGS